ncbi:MAG TPA: hypothetical protein VF665_18385 [Longimicrobium sp.]|jgi:hypothetical protein|uniref:hypothetical protein n=1 Tax=Longimicrobium sp. TaxID=2029185 RepID=UPI002ED9E37F
MTDSPLANDDLRAALEEAWQSDGEHVERMTLSAAVISAALERSAMRATLVGGGALEFYVPAGYQTSDLDFVVESGTRERIHQVLTSLGLLKNGRHWIRADLFVEVPGNSMTEPVSEFSIGDFTLRIIRREALLAERIVGYRYWKYWAYGQQSIELLQSFRSSMDEELLRGMLRAEGAEDTLSLLLGFLDSGSPLTTEALDRLWHAHYR